MSATIIDGKAVAARVRARGGREVAALAAEHGRAPGLATVLVGDDPASAIYVGNKQKACAEVGIEAFDHRSPARRVAGRGRRAHRASSTPTTAVSGILLQLPGARPPRRRRADRR